LKKIKLFTIPIIFLLFLLPAAVSALEMPGNFAASEKKATDEPDEIGITAFAYVVMDENSGTVLLEKNAKELWAPASLTKLVTAMVLLDSKPQLEKAVLMSAEDEVGGVRIRSTPGISFRFIDLLHATLLPSANNAAYALARTSGRSMQDFVNRMNLKTAALGAQNTYFSEPTGLSERSVTTAEDYAKILKAAFDYPLIKEIASKNEFSFGAVNSTSYWQKVTSTNNILNDSNFNSLIGKTGYIEVSKYNFVSEVSDKFGNNLAVVVLGSKDSNSRFTEARQLAMMGGLAKVFPGAPLVLGASIQADIALRNLVFK